jgi:hypothetical protein
MKRHSARQFVPYSAPKNMSASSTVSLSAFSQTRPGLFSCLASIRYGCRSTIATLKMTWLLLRSRRQAQASRPRVQLCADHGTCTIIDLHALPGYQHQHWHSDNPTHQALFWKHKQNTFRIVSFIYEAFLPNGTATMAGLRGTTCSMSRQIRPSK